MNNLSTLTSAQLKQAADLKDQIEALTRQLNAIVGGDPVPVAPVAPVVAVAPAAPTKPGRRPMSAAGRARLIAAQKARWAKVRADKAAASQPAAPNKAKRTMSAAARARIAAAQKARWAKVKAAKGA